MKYLFFVSIAYSFEILRPLQKAIRENGDEVFWYIYKDALRSQLLKDEVALGSIKEVMECSPDAVFAPGNWVPFFFPGLKVQVFHGFGIEKKGHFRIRNYFDLYCTHGPITTDRFKQLSLLSPHFRVVETGWPKVDPLFIDVRDESSKQPTILYAPTFSPSLTSIVELHLTIRALSEKYNWNWIIKFHPKTSDPLRSLFSEIDSEHLVIMDDEDILPLMQRSDVMISDTSSVITEFMLLDKPVIAFRNSTPGEHLKNIYEASDLEGLLLELFEKSPDWLLRQQKFVEQMHPYSDGKSAQRVVEATNRTIQLQKEQRLRKPLNLFRNLKAIVKMRKKLFDYFLSR